MRNKTSPRGIALIKHFESFSAVPYRLKGGKLTIGYGHELLKTDRITWPITVEQAVELMHNDLAHIEIYLTGVFPALAQNEFDALASFTFNVGLGKFVESTLHKNLKAGDKAGAAAQFPRWKYDNGVVLPGLVTRRAAERDMFMETAA